MKMHISLKIIFITPDAEKVFLRGVLSHHKQYMEDFIINSKFYDFKGIGVYNYKHIMNLHFNSIHVIRTNSNFLIVMNFFWSL